MQIKLTHFVSLLAFCTFAAGLTHMRPPYYYGTSTPSR